jgi:chromate transporter
MCVYFGMRAGGRWGGFLAGLAFMLPGFILMFTLSWVYVTFGANAALLATVFYGCKPAVLALIVRAVQRIGAHALTDRWRWTIALGVAAGSWAHVNLMLLLSAAGLSYAIVRRSATGAGLHAILLAPLSVVAQPAAVAAAPSLLALFGYGLRGGLLTFGGAYTAIPFLQADAVVRGAWMSNAQFLDGLALGGILPAPLIIFSTFVGFLGGGPLGALAMTAGIFLPAFAFTLVAHQQVERLIANTAAHAFLDGVTAGVVGLIGVTALGLARDAIIDAPTGALFVGALFALFKWKAKATVVGVLFGAGLLGWFLSTLSS